MRILVLTSCTGEKKSEPDNQLTQEDFQQSGTDAFLNREAELSSFRAPAEEIYTGLQHLRLMKGVDHFRKAFGDDSLNLWILSAGYGVIPGSRQIVPYECTFQGMKRKDLLQWSNHLEAPQDIRKVLSSPYDLGFVLLGDSYLKACQLNGDLQLGGPTLFFCGSQAAARFPGISRSRTIVLTNKEAKRFSCGLVGLKGEVAARLLRLICNKNFSDVDKLLDDSLDPLSLIEEDSRLKPPVSAPTRPASNVDYVIQISDSWWEKPHRKKLRYFIPEWDDLVDPDYDFETDTHSGGTGDWSNEVYAHQMYPEPNYDGILMSRAVAEKSKRKKERINTLGVHRFLRVPREFPIMGDCGAFDYIMADVPPYTTDDVIDYYTRLGFDYGVSVDHLIVTATEDQKNFRYELTINNAEEFIKAHHKAGLMWEPIGAVQGWDPESYAKAAEQYVKMGYQYIGLGGLVRSSTPDILLVLSKVKQVVPSRVGIHLFGLARLKALPQMTELGVTSVDSASALRRAWLGGKDNYWSETGNHYRAIRIPEAGKSFRAKRIVSECRASADFVAQVEKKCMEALRAYDKGNFSLDAVLEIIGEYDHLITPDRPVFLDEYRRTLEARPWKNCSSDICKKDGIEVIIFRGNNRNRRRGFHNTFVFYKLLRRVLETGDASFLFTDERGLRYPYQMSLFREK